MSDEITARLAAPDADLSKQEYIQALEKLRYNEIFDQIKNQLVEMGGSKPLTEENINYINDLAKRKTDNYLKELSTPKAPKLPGRVPDELLPKSKSSYPIPDLDVDKVRDIDIGAYQRDKLNKMIGKGGAALGLGMAGKHLYENDPGSAIADVIEGAASLAGPAASKASILAELLRPTSTASEEHEMSELEKNRKFKALQDFLAKQKTEGSRTPANEE